MLELIAIGPSVDQRNSVRLNAGHTLRVGRHSPEGLSIPWDPYLSQHHVTLTVLENRSVRIEPSQNAVNCVYVSGEAITSAVLSVGDFFVIGDTSFHLGSGTDSHSKSDQPEGIEAVRFEPGQLEQVPYRDPGKRIEVLTRLPELIWGARSDDDLHHRLAGLLLAGVTHADAVAIVELRPNTVGSPEITVLHWDRRQETAGSVRPSSRLVQDALGDTPQSILHTWDAQNNDQQYTVVGEFNWAYCTPIRDVPGERRAIYVAGRASGQTAQSGRPALESDVKYTELISEIVGAIRRVNRLERQRASFRQFFAPPILTALGDDPDTSLLEPRECAVTVMFCDLRDFSRHAENSSDDLIALLKRVSRIMGVITTQIHRFGGVTGDFQGDAALGFWGWPFPAATATQDACRAALGIRSELQRAAEDPQHPLAGFSLGIGLAHGRAVAGKIGTEDQVKVTVFGPVVNLASRLESLTRQLHVPILMDEATADRIRDTLGPEEARLRRLAKVLPYGFETPHIISELLPPLEHWPELTDDHIARFEQGVDHFLAGDWESAYRCLRAMPDSDRAQDFLTMLITQHNRIPPADWDGIVRLPGK